MSRILGAFIEARKVGCRVRRFHLGCDVWRTLVAEVGCVEAAADRLGVPFILDDRAPDLFEVVLS